MIWLRRIALMLLLPALVAGSVTMAVARHQPRAIGEVWLCTGTGMVALSVDADGNPVGPMVPCPECTLSLAALTDPGVAAAGVMMKLVPLRLLLPVARSHVGYVPPVPPARGPPGLV